MAAFLYRISITENRNKCHPAPKRPSSFCHTASTAQMLRAGIEKYRVFKVPTFLPKLMTADGSFHAQARFIQKQTFFMR
jgi:hypothetical protein